MAASAVASPTWEGRAAGGIVYHVQNRASRCLCIFDFDDASDYGAFEKVLEGRWGGSAPGCWPIA